MCFSFAQIFFSHIFFCFIIIICTYIYILCGWEFSFNTTPSPSTRVVHKFHSVTWIYGARLSSLRGAARPGFILKQFPRLFIAVAFSAINSLALERAYRLMVSLVKAAKFVFLTPSAHFLPNWWKSPGAKHAATLVRAHPATRCVVLRVACRRCFYVSP